MYLGALRGLTRRLGEDALFRSDSQVRQRGAEAALSDPLARGETLGAFAVTEPSAGSDPGSITTRAEDKGDHYILNGAKVFITNGSYADVIVLIARTGTEKGNRGLSAFLLTKETPGFTIGRREEKMGLCASDTAELIFDDCRIPPENLLGKAGNGFTIAMVALDSGRIGIASQSLGIARACLDEAIRHAKTRKQFGKSSVLTRRSSG